MPVARAHFRVHHGEPERFRRRACESHPRWASNSLDLAVLALDPSGAESFESFTGLRIFWGTLLSSHLLTPARFLPYSADRPWSRALRLAARPPRQVIAHHIGNHGHKHQNHGDPQTPIMMRMFPVRTMEAMMNTVAIRTFVLVVTVLCLIHEIAAFPIPSRMISGRRCYRSAASTSSSGFPASPGRACRCNACAR